MTKAMTLNWKSNKISGNAQIALKTLDKTLKLNSKDQISSGNRGELISGVGILADAIKFNREVPTARQLKIIRESVIKLKKGNEPLSADNLLWESNKIYKQFLSRPIESFILATTISLQYFENIKQIRFEGVVITFSQTLPISFKKGARSKNVRNRPPHIYRNEPAGYTVVKVHVKARDATSAAEIALDRLDTLRGIWNMFLNWNMQRETFGTPSPHNRILLGRMRTIHYTNGMDAEDNYWYEPFRTNDPTALSIKVDFSELKSFEGDIRQNLNKSSYKKKLLELLVRYTRALDESNQTSSFLKLWSVLEGVTDSSNYETLVKRASFLWVNSSWAKRELNYIRTWRNKSVHESMESEDAEHILNRLRDYVDKSLHFAITHPKYFKSETDFGLFLDSPRNKKDIQHKIKQLEMSHQMHKKVGK